ncbi:LuxE/PaaK family acyltransferase [Pareuzebyella sediminis]|uniref:LuxE/PaaK family acyltransferase n=1 Tax=Pareuzebyella sediminis TaxID=2607998 RepID=UPI0011F01754|nr:acyl transferase [Pareuzebyella sediminis]
MAFESIINITSQTDFEAKALETFNYQYKWNTTYRQFCDYLKKNAGSVQQVDDIPFLPISFFKTHKIISGKERSVIVFSSSGTTGSQTSKHFVQDLEFYKKSYSKGFQYFYGAIKNYCVLALLPSYLEREGSSLVYMVQDLIVKSGHPQSGFYLNNMAELRDKLEKLEHSGTKTLLIGVSFALLDMVEQYPLQLRHTIVMETGGMKGRRKELIREELHDRLKKGFGIDRIHSEYGMTELLSQAYSKGNGVFETPPWMNVKIRSTQDPLSYQPIGKTGGLNIIDLANRHSCSFIATQDLGKVNVNGGFEVLGRFDHSDVRGCNLMML